MSWKFIAALVLLACVVHSVPGQTKADLSEISICLDPGHGLAGDGTFQNKGMYGYSETEKALSVALHLKTLLEHSGIDTVILTRSTNTADISLTQRAALANNYNVDWFHSIHSNSSNTANTNYVLVLVEEKRQMNDNSVLSSDSRGLGLGVAYWHGTADVMARMMSDKVARTLRTTNSGMRLDWTFYGGTNGGISLGALRSLTMPAVLSKGAFHSNPTQNLRNMNDQYRRAEAKALWMSVLEYFGVQRPPIHTVLGIVSDRTTGAPLNDVTVETEGHIYKTNSFQETFRYWQVGDTTAGNGIYYFENLPAGSQLFTFRKAGYRDTTLTISAADTFFTFQDISLTRVAAAGTQRPDTVPLEFSLEQNFPNPFNPTTVISFTLPQAGRVRLDVLNLLGEPVAILLDEERETGTHHITWNGTNQDGNIVPSGVYFYKLRHGSSTLTRKMVFVR